MDEFDRAENERLGRSLEKYSFAGEHAKNADLEALEKAKQMRLSVVADETIRQQTGWFMGRDGKWRWEIDDSGMEYSDRGDMNFRQRNKNYDRYRQLTEKQERHMLELSDEQLTESETKELQQLREIYASTFRHPGRISEDALPMEQLSDYIKHDALFEAYPQLRKTRLRFADFPEGTRGQYDPEQDIITLSKKLRGKPQDTLIHEIQHVIQKAEGFAQGSSPEFWDNREVTKPEYASAVQKARDRVERAEHAFRREWIDDTNLNLAKQYIELDERFWSDEMDPGKWQEIEKQKEQIEQIAVEDGWEDLFNDYYYAVGELQMAIERAKWHLRTPIDLYSNTAGEIEARDSTARRTMTQEQRKNRPPDLGDENTVFAEGDAVAKDFVGWNADGNEVYTTSQDTLKLSISDRIAKFKDDFLNNFRGRTAKFSRNGHTHYARFVETTKGLGKFAYEGDSRSSPNGYKAKIRMLADGNIFELVEDADYKNTGTEKGKATVSHKNAKHWDYYVKTIVVDGKGFDVIVNVRVDVPGGSYSSKEEFVYSILFKDNKTVATSVVSPASSKVLRQNDVATKNIIDQDIENVNNAMRIGADGTSGEQYSFSDAQTDEQSRRPAEGDYTTDEVEMQARKKGYPVLHGEQIVPFRTWVQTKDRGNYGLVTGMAPENKLLVSFHNKHDGGTADNVAIAYDNLVPVPGAYQMTKEEFASLMASEPLDPGSENFSEEDMRAIEELYRQANGGEEKAVTPIDLDKLPKKAQNFLKRTQRKLLNHIRDSLGVPRHIRKEYLQGVVEEITGEYLNSGTVSDEKLGELFDKAYAQGIVEDREFYDQYKHIKDYLRTTAVTLSEQDRSNIADFNDFRNRQFGRLRIVNKGGLPVDTAYDELRSMAPDLFPEHITHPADQLVHMAEVARSIAISKKTLDEYFGPEVETFRAWARNDFDVAVGEVMGDLHTLRRFADERAASAAREAAPTTPEEAEEAYKKLKKARRSYERAAAKNLLTQHDETQVGRLLRHEIELEHLDPEKDNVKGITAVYEAKAEYERLCKLITEYKRRIHGELRAEADEYLETANNWKDKKTGIAYARETMRRNIYDIVADRALARRINEAYFEPVHDAEARAVRMKDDYRNKVRNMDLSRKIEKGNLVSEAHAVQLLGEAEDNIRILENTKGRMQNRDGKSLAEWRAVVSGLWAENPNLDEAKIRAAVQQFRQIYDDLFKHMNRVRVENGYEPINYRSGYFPHFQPGAADGILAQFGRALGIDTQVVALPTTITGLTHTFKPGIQWFGNAQERLGFNTAYDAVEGFDKYIEGAASVIFQTRNIQRLRAFATQVRYRTSKEGIQKQVDAVYEDNRLTDEEKQVKIADIYEHGKYALANFVAELDEYTNLLANKKSKYDRTVEALMGRKSYAFLKWWESRVGANMIAGNVSSALTNLIPLTQAGAQMDKSAILKGMWQTLASYKTDDGLVGMSSFLTNRRGSNPLVQTWQQKVSEKLGMLMEGIDQFVSGSIVRGAYYHNLKRGMSETEAMHQADIFAAGVMADRSKGAMPTLMQASNPLFKMFTQFQLEVNNQFSEVFKDLPRNHKQQGKLHFALVLFQYFLGAWAFNELYEKLMGRRAALDPIGILVDAGKDFVDPDVGFGEGVSNLFSNVLSELPFSSGLTLIGFETDGGRIPASSAVPDLSAIWDAATEKGWSAEKRWSELQTELNKLSYVIPPFGGNQISKIWKGTKAFIEGGSYTVDTEGNDILQYPVYKDDPWSALGALFRATLLGKSSLPEAQEWVNSGFDSLNAKETAVYQDMLNAGISQREAFTLLQELGTAEETDELSKEAVQRNVLQDTNASGEGKAIAYYGILATHDEDDPEKLTERVIMDQLAEMGADPWEVTKALMAIKDAGGLDGAEETKAKYDAIIQAALTDEEKTVLVGSIIGTEMQTDKGNMTQYAKFKIAVEGSMTVDEYLEFRKAGGDIDDYLGFANAGLDPDDAADVSLALDELEPVEGKEQVSDVQKWRTCVDTFSNEATQLAALAAKMNDSQRAKLNIAYEYSVSPDTYVTLKEILPKFDADGSGGLSQAEITKAINSIKGLTNTQRAVLWQISISGKSAKNNPYSTKVGQQVLDALDKG